MRGFDQLRPSSEVESIKFLFKFKLLFVIVFVVVVVEVVAVVVLRVVVNEVILYLLWRENESFITFLVVSFVEVWVVSEKDVGVLLKVEDLVRQNSLYAFNKLSLASIGSKYKNLW